MIKSNINNVKREEGASNGNGVRQSFAGTAQALTSEQKKFIDAVNETLAMLDGNRLKRDEWMVIAGGAVFLYQLYLEYGKGIGKADRVPTDLDVVVNNNITSNQHILELLRDRMPNKDDVVYSRGPNMHFGHVLLGPTLGYSSAGGLPIDIITELSQIYPDDHKFAPSVHYKYPSTDKMLRFAKQIEHPLLNGTVTLAHPGFVAFYKLMLARNTEGKQDNADLIRLKKLGLLDPSEELDMVIDTMCLGDKDFADKVKKAIADL